MSHMYPDLLPIGGFARATRLSLKALRLYDQLGILTPRFIDPDSGYRFYGADQIHQARLIRMMRQMDMPLATIRRVLAQTPSNAERLVRDYWREVEARVEQARGMVHVVISYLYQEDPMTLDVSVRNVDPQPVVSITRRVKVDQLDNYISESLARLFDLVKERGGSVTGSPLGLFHGPINHEDDGPIEICVPVERAVDVGGDVEAKELPGGQIASVDLRGDQCDFPAVLQGYDAVYDWIRKNGYEADGAPREIWHSPPGAAAHMEIAALFRTTAR